MLTHPNNNKFLILTSNTSQNTLKTITSQILTHLHLPFHINLIKIYTNCSINITLSPKHNSNNTTIIHHTNTTIYTTKKNKQKQFYIFTPKINQQIFKYL